MLYGNEKRISDYIKPVRVPINSKYATPSHTWIILIFKIAYKFIIDGNFMFFVIYR